MDDPRNWYKILIVIFFGTSLVEINFKWILQQIYKIFVLNTDKGLLLGFVLSNYETTLAFLCKTMKALNEPLTVLGSIYSFLSWFFEYLKQMFKLMDKEIMTI